MFPIIENINDILPYIRDKKEFGVYKQGDMTLVLYRIMSSSTFDSIQTRECRGLVFDNNGNIISRPLHKFYSLGETTDFQDVNKESVVRIMEKLDGSMIHPFIYKDTIVWKTKGSFDNNIIDDSFELRKQYEPHISHLLREYTPVFEYISPTNQVVVKYTSPRLVLTHIRNIKTGAYIRREHFNILVNEKYLDIVNDVPLIYLEDILNNTKNYEDIEGYVLQLENGEMIKLKTDWFTLLHTDFSSITERRLAELIIDNKLDDIRYKLNIMNINYKYLEDKIVYDLNQMKYISETLYEENKRLTRIEFVKKFKDHTYFHFLMTLFSGKIPNYSYYYKRYFLKDFSLDKLDRLY